MQDAGAFDAMFAVACQNWTWLSAAMVLGVLVGWVSCRKAAAE
jgi:hypothetical protein